MENDIEYDFVEKFYNENAESFSNTRYKPWPKTKVFLEKYVFNNSMLLDIGCGNGRNMKTMSMNCLSIGCDRSLELLKMGPGSIRCDATSLPFRDNSFEIVLSVAVIHHLKNPDRRREALKEMRRVMKRNGLIYVWNHKYIKDKYRKISVNNINLENDFKPEESSKPRKDINPENDSNSNNDVIATWRGRLLRYVHFFDFEEFRQLIESVGFKIEEIGEEGESYYAYVYK